MTETANSRGAKVRKRGFLRDSGFMGTTQNLSTVLQSRSFVQCPNAIHIGMTPLPRPKWLPASISSSVGSLIVHLPEVT